MSPSAHRAGAWKVRLDGHAFDLEDARSAASGLPGASIEEDADGSFLLSSEFVNLTSPADVAREAERIVDLLNAVTRAHSEASKAIRVAAVVDPAGRRHLFASVIDSVEARSRVGVIAVVTRAGSGAEQLAPASAAELELPRRARAYDSDADIRRAVDFLNVADDTFGSIYKAFEVVRDDLGGENEIAALTGISKTRISAFRQSANRSVLTGDKARHATLDTKPIIISPMSLPDARDLVRKIVLTWMDTKR